MGNDLPHSITFTIQTDGHGQRIDRWLSGALADHSRSELQRWIKSGRVTVDGQPIRVSHTLENGETIVVDPPARPVDSTLIAEDIPLDILYEDPNAVVVNKAAGMVVHPAAGHTSGTLVNAVLHHCPDIQGVGGEKRPGIVHRLDKDTSGVIIVAKNDATHNFLQQQFQNRTVYKEYLTLLEGVIDPPAGRINAPIGRHPIHRKRQAILPPDPLTGESPGREAITEYEMVSHFTSTVRDSAGRANFSLVKVILYTGRTHQIRVHFAWQKHPVVGDTTYGYRRQRIKLERHFLHAHRLHIQLPNEETPRQFVAPLPPELQAILDGLEAE